MITATRAHGMRVSIAVKALLLTSAGLAMETVGGAAAGAGEAPNAPRPNIVFILADDLGWTDLGITGSRYYETPNIDALAADGLRFTSCYTAAANCTPTRAALMSGQYAPRTGVYNVHSLAAGPENLRKLTPPANSTRLPLEKATIAQALRAANYATAIFGKWHLGQAGEYHPARRGFDEALVSAGRHFDFAVDPAVDVPPGVYLADFLTDRALDFIARRQHGPFFLYLSHFAVHRPHVAKPELIAKFRDKKGSGGHRDATYAAMIASVDESVGRVLRKLEELGLSENTLVIFTSDNGGLGGYRAASGEGGSYGITDNAPLRGGKGMFYEGGIRVPLIVRWPGTIPRRTVTDVPVISVDFFPTLLELARVDGEPPQALDGVSLVPTFLSGGRTNINREALYWHFPGYFSLAGSGPDLWCTRPVGAIRRGAYKLMEFFEDGRLELYDVEKDRGETINLAGAEPARARALQRELAAWRKAIGAAMLEPNPNYAPQHAGAAGAP